MFGASQNFALATILGIAPLSLQKSGNAAGGDFWYQYHK